MAKVDPGEGYRWLVKGDEILPTDEKSYGDAYGWEPVEMTVGMIWSEKIIPMRRRVESAPAVDPASTGAQQLTLCGCGKHTIDFGADPYAAHNDWLETAGGWGTAQEYIYGGIRPDTARMLTVLGADASADDVARDAQRTTGGKTLDDVIAECTR